MSVRTYLPENLDLSTVLKPDWREYGAWVVGGLYLRRHTEKQRDPEGFFPLSSEFLTRVLPKRDYVTILDSLAGGGVVERDNSYCTPTPTRKGWPKGCRLTPAYRDVPFRTAYLTHRELVRKVDALRARKEARRRGPSPLHDYLEDNLRRLEVTADAPDEIPLLRLRDREFTFEVCRQGRVHTNLTNLSREFRKYLRVGGEPLVGIDVVNSQPLLLALLLSGSAGAQEEELKRYSEWLFSRRSRLTDDEYSLLKAGEEERGEEEKEKSSVYSYSNPGQEDIASFLSLCLEGRVYEKLMDLTGFDRDTTKVKFYQVAYGHPRLGLHTQLGQAFRTAFPACWDAMCRLKLGDHGGLARRMQTAESHLVIWKTCSRLMRDYPRAPLLTLHDCLVTTEEHAAAFGDALRAEFEAAHGIRPGLKKMGFVG